MPPQRQRSRGGRDVQVGLRVRGAVRQVGRIRLAPGRGLLQRRSSSPAATPSATVVTALQRIPRSPSTVRVTGTLATTWRASPASSGSISTTECTSVVAPPMSTTTTSPAPARSSSRPCASSSTAVSTTSGVAPRTIAVKSARGDRCLPPMTWRRNISRMAARAESGASTPIFGTTLSARTYGVPASPSRVATSSRASTLPATTTGPAQRSFASVVAQASSTSLLPPSVPPTSSTTSGRSARSAATSSGPSPPAATCTTRPPLESATRRPASAVTSSSLPTTAMRRPPPADEQASTSAAAAPGTCAVSSARQASHPSSTSVSIVVRWLAVASSRPSDTSTRAALVNVDPKSTQATRCDPAGRVVEERACERLETPGAAEVASGG